MRPWSKPAYAVALGAAVITGIAALLTATVGGGDGSDWLVAAVMGTIVLWLLPQWPFGRKRSDRGPDG